MLSAFHVKSRFLGPPNSYKVPVLVILGDADDPKVECDDDADGEDEAERVVGDGEDGVVPK